MVIDEPHRRFNPLTGEWVLVSAGRNERPWQGGAEPAAVERRPVHDPGCYLCPSNQRADGTVNPRYETTFVFTNDFAALRPNVHPARHTDGLLTAETQAGTCRVICYSPRHDQDLATLNPAELRNVIDLWADQVAELSRAYEWVQVFENRGAAMGASSPHPHGQIWAGSALPGEPAKEDVHQRRYWDERGSVLLLDYLAQEQGGERMVACNATWAAVVPFWAVWPFELLLIPTGPVATLPDLPAESRSGLGELLREVLGRYDRVFDAPFPYSMGWHGAPTSQAGEPHWQLHAHLYPPLLRSATVRKHMVGYELLAEAQRDLTAEAAAARLRSLGSHA